MQHLHSVVHRVVKVFISKLQKEVDIFKVAVSAILNENEDMAIQILIIGIHLARSTRGKPCAPPARCER